jgi:nicotinamidase-related amidase
MPRCLASVSDSLLLLVDLQPTFLAAIHESDRVLARSGFIAEAAKLLGAPIVATEQYPSRMGGTDPSMSAFLSCEPMAKMDFSCCGSQELVQFIEDKGRNQIVLVGIETHICVNQTAHELMNKGFEVIVCADATSSRTVDRHEIGLKRISEAGATIAHTESVVYEWLKTADHPNFREALKLVKAAKW